MANNFKKPRRELSKLFGWTLVPLLLIATWEVASRAMENYLFPPASVIFDLLIHPTKPILQHGSLLGNTFVSLLRVLLGFSVAAIAGVALGLVMGSVRVVRNLFEPLVEIMRPICPIAWIPFAITVFGLTTVPQLFGARYTDTVLDQMQIGMVFVLFYGGFFPVLVNTLDGVAGVRRNYLALARTLGARPVQIFFHVHLPAAFPNILTGLRQGVSTSWFVLIAAEMLPGCNSGVGFLLMEASDLSEMDVVIAAMLIVGGIGAALNFLLRWMMSALVRWQTKEN